MHNDGTALSSPKFYSQRFVIDFAVVCLEMTNDGHCPKRLVIRIPGLTDDIQQRSLSPRRQCVEQTTSFGILPEELVQFLGHGQSVLAFVFAETDADCHSKFDVQWLP